MDKMAGNMDGNRFDGNRRSYPSAKYRNNRKINGES